MADQQAEGRETLRHLNELVNGGGWEDAGKHVGVDWVRREIRLGRSLFYRCCGKRMAKVRWEYRVKGFERYPANSRGSRRQINSPNRLECQSCGYVVRVRQHYHYLG